MKLNISKKIFFVENKDFQTIQIRVLFPFEEKEKDIAKIALLPNLLIYMNEEYNTEEKYQKAKMENMIQAINCSRIMIGTTGYLSFNLLIPDTHSLRKNILEKQIKFFEKMIYHPKIINQGFDPFEVEREINSLTMAIENNSKKINFYQARKGLELIDKDGILSRSIDNHQEQLKEITPQNLYEYYLKIIKNKTPMIFVMGNVDKQEITEYINKYLYKKNTKVQYKIDLNYNYFQSPNKDIQRVSETSNFKSSSLSLYYKVENMKKSDAIYLELIRNLLASLSSHLLNKKLRNEYELIYSSKVIDYPNFGIFEITVHIDKDKKDITEEKIQEVLENLKDPEFIAPYLENIKNRKRINLLRLSDDKFSILSDYMKKTLKIEKKAEEQYKQIKQIKPQEIADFINRLKLDTVYFIEEETHEH